VYQKQFLVLNSELHYKTLTKLMKQSRYLHLLLLSFIFVTLAATSFAQDDNHQDVVDKIISFPDKIFNRIDKEASKTEERITNNTEKYLNKLQRQEEKLKRKLWKTDSTKAKEVFGDVQARYDALRNSMTAPAGTAQGLSNTYNGHIDSVGTAMKFLQANQQLIQGTEAIQKITTNLESVTNLQNRFNQTELIRKQLQQRQQYLKEQLQNTALVKEFQKFRKNVYYVQQQAREYKETLSNPDKLGKKLLETAMKFPAFKQFFANNSELAALFPMPGNPPPQGGVGGGYGPQVFETF
jgi:predicted RNase H-like nuclease (RuvC/YqgF family)